MEFKRIKEVFPTWKITGAIFAELATRDVPWADSFSARAIGLDYYGNFSGNKIISSLIENILPPGGVLTSDEIVILADVIMGLYATKWLKLWATMLFEYNPIQNYNMVETMTDDETVTEYGKTNTRTDNLQHQRTDNLSSQRTDNLQRQRTDDLTSQRTDDLQRERTDNLSSQRTDNLQHQRTDNLSSQRTDNLQHQRTDNLTSQRTDNLSHSKEGTETDTPDTTTEDNNSVFGFNSVNPVPSDSRTIENTGTNEKAYDVIERDTGTQTQLNTGTQSEANTGTQTQLNTGTQTEADTGTQTQLNTGTQTEADTGTQTQHNTGTQTEADTGTQTQLNTGTQTEADTGTQKSEDSGTDTSTRNYQLTRSGNIGVTTSQQMIESERNLWREWDFFREIVYPDIDRVLTIEIY